MWRTNKEREINKENENMTGTWSYCLQFGKNSRTSKKNVRKSKLCGFSQLSIERTKNFESIKRNKLNKLESYQQYIV